MMVGVMAVFDSGGDGGGELGGGGLGGSEGAGGMAGGEAGGDRGGLEGGVVGGEAGGDSGEGGTGGGEGGGGEGQPRPSCGKTGAKQKTASLLLAAVTLPPSITLILLGALLDVPCVPILNVAMPGRDFSGTAWIVGLDPKTTLPTLVVELA